MHECEMAILVAILPLMTFQSMFFHGFSLTLSIQVDFANETDRFRDSHSYSHLPRDIV